MRRRSTRDALGAGFVLAATTALLTGCTGFPTSACESEGTSALSPDGRTLVVALPDSSWNHLFAVDLGTRSVRRLTKGDCDEYPAWSPDGRRIAFLWQDFEITVVTSTGGDRRSPDGGDVARDDLEWTRDGRSLVYGIEDKDGIGGDVSYDIGVLPRAGGKADRPYHHARFPALSPGNHEIAYVSESTNDMYIAAYPPRTGSPRHVLSVEGMSSLAWSPDGRWIAFHTPHGLNIVAPDGLGRRLVIAASSADFPTWTPDSRCLYYGTSNALWRTAIAGGQPTQVLDFDESSKLRTRD
jgi:Tol biopolymer transport system component